MAVWTDPTRGHDERVEALLADMTLEEKLAQLGSAWFRTDDPRTDDPGGDVAPMQGSFSGDSNGSVKHGIGHLTRIFGTRPVTAAEGARELAQRQRFLRESTRLGIPAIAHEECLTGFTTFGATVYPAPLAWAASFDPALIERMAAAIGRDMRAVGVHQGLAPVLDVVRDYRWGRVEETMGEDPYLVAVTATAYVRGLQSQGIIGTLKHFAGYSASRGGRNHAPVSIGPRELADVILPPFEMAVREAAVGSVMNSYADLDGVPAGAHAGLLTGTLRDEWGFDGVVVSDYWAVPFLETMHRVAGSPAGAARLALEAGIDVELPATGCYGEPLADLVRSGQVAEQVVDRAVRRVLRQKIELGLLDPEWSPDHDGAAVDFDTAENRALSRDIAERSVILLANDGILPLASTVRTIAVVGPCADEPRAFLGCYSYPNHVLDRYPAHELGITVPSLLDELRAGVPEVAIAHHPGCPIADPDRSGIPAAAEVASAADLVLIVVGDRAGLFGRGTSGEGCDAADLTLPGVQAELVDAVLDAGTPAVLIVVSGRPYALGDFASRFRAIVQSFMPGEAGGSALVNVLTGRTTPTGKLPVQVPANSAAQPGTYLHPPLGGRAGGVSNLDNRPLFPFGHGLSYTTFEYDDLRLSATEIPTDGEVRVSCRVRNSGTRAGREIVQLYFTDPVAQVARPVIQLAGFTAVTLEAGEHATVSFSLHADRTAYTATPGHRVVEPGAIDLMIGSSSVDIRLSATLELTGPTRTVGPDRHLTTPTDP